MYKSAANSSIRIICQRTPDKHELDTPPPKMMKGFLCFLVLLVSMFCLGAARPQDSAPGVQLIRYKNDAEADSIIRGVIAQYEQLGGTSEFHNFRTPYTQANQVQVLQRK